MKTNNIIIGERIKQTRTELNMSLENLAERIGVDKSTISRYETGKISNIKLPVIGAIAKELNVNPSWLLYKSETREVNDDENDLPELVNIIKYRPEIKKLIELAVSASSDQTEKIIRIWQIVRE